MTLYDKLGIRFQYPENWKIREEETKEWPRSVVAESPGGAFWALHVYPDEQDCRLLSDQVAGAMRAEYDSLESAPPADLEMLEAMIEGEIIGQDMTFYCLDFLVMARVRCFHSHGKTFVTLSQAEDRDFEELNLVFQAMTVGLLKALDG